MLEIISIDKKEFLDILTIHNIKIPIWSDIEAIDCYKEKEMIKICKNDNPLAVLLIPIDKNGVRREYRYFPYVSPIFLKEISNRKQKEILKEIFNYLFTKYDYCFIPLHPDFKMVSSIQSESGFVEMRHTHVISQKLLMDKLDSKIRNHIRSASRQIEIIIDYDYSNYDFEAAIKGSENEVIKRSDLAKKLISNKKAITIKAKYNDKIIAGLVVAYDKKWAYLLHSYNNKDIRGTISLLIYTATEFVFDKLNIKYFDLEGSVIDEIDDFFSNFNVNIITYPYLIQAKDEKMFFELINRSVNIVGRINRCKDDNKNR